MQEDYICSDVYMPLIIEKALELYGAPGADRKGIARIMSLEYGLAWIRKQRESFPGTQVVDENEKTAWKGKRRAVMQDLVVMMGRELGPTYVLKGDAALMLCYGLDRFSDTVDLDSRDLESIRPFMDSYAKNHGYACHIEEETNRSLHYLLDFGDGDKPLGIKVSLCHFLEVEDRTWVNGMPVYTIREFARSKVGAYTGRDMIDDLYDVCFIAKHYFDDLPKETKKSLRETLFYKGLHQVEYLMTEASNPQIDNGMLLDGFLDLCEELDVFIDKKEATEVKEYVRTELPKSIQP